MHRHYLIALLFLLLLIPYYPVSSAQGWLSGWKYRKPITISNTNNPNGLADFQVLVVVDTASLVSAGKMKSDCSDIRFTDENGTLLPYWIEDGTANTENTRIWVKVPSIPAGSTKTIFMYYGNPSASPASNGDAVFLFFDDFNGVTLNTSKWNIVDVWNANYTLSNGQLVVKLFPPVSEDADFYIEQKQHFSKAFPFIFEIYRTYAEYDVPLESSFNVVGLYKKVTQYVSYMEYEDNVTDSIPPHYHAIYPSGGVIIEYSPDVFKPHHHKIVINTTHAMWYVDGVLKSRGPLPLDSDVYVFLDLYAEAGSSYVEARYDYLFVRSFADPEPTITVGSEQSVASQPAPPPSSQPKKPSQEPSSYVVVGGSTTYVSLLKYILPLALSVLVLSMVAHRKRRRIPFSKT